MKRRSGLAAAFLCIMQGILVPLTAHGQELGAASAAGATSLPAADRLELVAVGDPPAGSGVALLANEALEATHARMGAATLATLRARAPLPGPLSSSPANIRLTDGQKTAIIIGAIIVGVLIIVGVVALKGPKPKAP